MYTGDKNVVPPSLKQDQRLKIKKLALAAMLGCMLSAFKFMLSALPNIEVVTLLIMVSSVVCGLQISLAATLVFCTVELYWFGFTPFSLCYFLHWPIVAIATVIASKYLKTEIGYAVLAFFVTAFFGIQSSVTYVLLSGGLAQSDTFWHKVGIVYANGILFYLTHIIGNCLGVLFLFRPAKRIMEKLYREYIS